MDSLRLPKGGGSKSSSSIPLAIKFNAGTENVEDIIKPSESLSSSPQQSSDDFSWRKEFLQGNFFHRKRSDSIEGNSTPGGASTSSTLISNLSSGNDTNIGTWKLIKGKVSQAMEDIKSSKSTHTISKAADSNEDSDLETINSSISDELYLDQTLTTTTTTITGVGTGIETGTGTKQKKKLPPSNPSSRTGNKTDSDSDFDTADVLLTVDDVESSTIRKSFANLRSKASITKHSSKLLTQKKFDDDTTMNRPGTTMIATPSTSYSSIRPQFLRKRRKQQQQQDTDTGAVVAGIKSKSKKDIEIESGVEMLEDMILPSITVFDNNSSSLPDCDDKIDNKTNQAKDIAITFTKESISYRIPMKKSDKSDKDNFNIDSYKSNEENLLNGEGDGASSTLIQQGGGGGGVGNQKANELIKKINYIMHNIYRNCSLIIIFALCVLLLVLPLPDFFRGVICSCLATSFFSCLFEKFKNYIEQKNSGKGPERTKFQIPDYSSMPIYEILAVEEHKPMKSYSGWMNEINNYDPVNYHISMTRSVFVRLDGTILRLSNTSSRIPKRSMWNEQSIDRKNVKFTQHRYFNLLGCRVEMCPRGLARKRHFSRKYPIQLIIKTSDASKQDDDIKAVYPAAVSSLIDQGEYFQQQSTSSSIGEIQQNPSGQNNNGAAVDNNARGGGGGGDVNNGSGGVIHQSSNDSVDDKSERTQLSDLQNDLDFGTTILNSDLQRLQNTSEINSKDNVPCADETRILLFARCDREKEDWYRRFYAASIGAINDQELRIPDIVMVTDEEIASAVKATCSDGGSENIVAEDEKKSTSDAQKRDSHSSDITSTFEGLQVSSCSARNPPDYVKFMLKFQKTRAQTNERLTSSRPVFSTDKFKRGHRNKSKEDELWKGVDQSLYLGPSGSIVWANVLLGRIIYSCLNDAILLEKIQEFLQKKLSAIRLPSFMEDVVISEVYLGDTPPIVHRVMQPLLDERGTWIEADVTFEGLMHMTITTKLNLLRLKRQQNQATVAAGSATTASSTTAGATEAAGATTTTTATTLGQSSLNANDGSTETTIPSSSSENVNFIAGDVNSSSPHFVNCAIYDSNAESTGASSSESESPTVGTTDTLSEAPQTFYTTPGSSRRLLRIVDRITASNLFQSATEISYIQRAMENMSTKITLRVELKGLISRVIINIPPPPSDRIWIAFRGPPRLWISAKPTVGDHAFDWSIVTNVIESKLCDEVYKYLVYPNMVDIIVPFLGQSTYRE